MEGNLGERDSEIPSQHSSWMRSQRLVDTRLMPSDCESMWIAFSMSTNEIEVVFGTLLTSTCILSIASRMGGP